MGRGVYFYERSFDDPVRADKPYQTIATDDIGGFVALAFERPQQFIGVELEIAGSELTNIQAAEVFSRVMNRPVKFQKLPMPVVRLFLGKEFYEMFHWFTLGGRPPLGSITEGAEFVPVLLTSRPGL